MYDERGDFDHHKAEVDEALALFESLQIVLPPDACVLDLGGGQGMHRGALQRSAHQVVCADILDYSSLYDGTFPQKLREKYARNALALDLSRCAFIRTDAMNMLFRDSFFDCCFSFNAFEHIPDPRRAFGEVMRVLKPGAVAYISLDPIWTCDTGSHFFGRVPAPWQHLVSEPEEFRDAMRRAGADAEEVAQFPGAMNRMRLADYETALRAVAASPTVELLHHDRYSGFSDPSHDRHPNYRNARSLGYSDEELRLRRLRWIIKRRR